MTVLNLIKSFLGLEPGPPPVTRTRAPPAGEPASPAAPPEGQAAPTTDDRIADLISRQGSSSQSLMAGSLELVGLDEIKEALGSRWADLAARASELAEQGIRRRLSEADILQVLSDTEFSICFSRLDREAAVERAKQISREIKQEIFAELPEFSSSVTVK